MPGFNTGVIAGLGSLFKGIWSDMPGFAETVLGRGMGPSVTARRQAAYQALRGTDWFTKGLAGARGKGKDALRAFGSASRQRITAGASPDIAWDWLSGTQWAGQGWKRGLGVTARAGMGYAALDLLNPFSSEGMFSLFD